MLLRQVNDQIRDYMRKTIQLDYGVNLDSDWNRMVTDAWDGAQHKVLTVSVLF